MHSGGFPWAFFANRTELNGGFRNFGDVSAQSRRGIGTRAVAMESIRSPKRGGSNLLPSVQSKRRALEAGVGIEPASTALQAAA